MAMSGVGRADGSRNSKLNSESAWAGRIFSIRSMAFKRLWA